MARILLSVEAVVGSDICVASEDGHKLHDKIYEAITNGNSVAVSFRGVRRLTTAFLNAAIGQLYNEFAEDKIRACLDFLDLDDATSQLLQRVIARARAYFRASEDTRRQLREIVEDN